MDKSKSPEWPGYFYCHIKPKSPYSFSWLWWWRQETLLTPLLWPQPSVNDFNQLFLKFSSWKKMTGVKQKQSKKPTSWKHFPWEVLLPGPHAWMVKHSLALLKPLSVHTMTTGIEKFRIYPMGNSKPSPCFKEGERAIRKISHDFDSKGWFFCLLHGCSHWGPMQ